MTNKIILPGAWELTQDLTYQLFMLKVPIAWQQKAKYLAKERANNSRLYPSIPVYSLDSIISASFPQIVKTVRKGWQIPGIPWLFATEKVDLSDLPQLIKDWLTEEFNFYLGDEYVDSILDTLKDEDWQWEETETKHSLLKQPKNYDEEFRFQAIPEYIARKFLENNTVCFQGENIEHQLNFYPVIRLNRGAELMSWPPYEIPLIKNKNEREGTAHISFVISFTLQTVPRRKQPLLYHHLSTRRWISQPLEKGFPYKGSTAFIGDNRRWLDGTRQPYSFIPLKIKEQGKRAKWHPAISQLLMINDSPLPEIESIANQPQHNWSKLNEQPEGIQIAIPYDSRHIVKQPCLPGVNSRDLASLDEAIIERISDNLPLKRVGEAVKISSRCPSYWGKVNSKRRGDPEPKKPDDLSNPMHRPSLAAPAVFAKRENHLQTILIVWETKECRDKLMEEICVRLCLNSNTDTQVYNTPGGGEVKETIYSGKHGSICIKTLHVADLTRNFDIAPRDTKIEKQRKREQFMNERIEKIKSYLLQTEELCGAIVEIKPKPWIAETDPKLAWRIGAAQANYLNQHITSITSYKKNVENRVKAAVSDLFRQFAILPTTLIQPETDKIPLHTWLTCFYVLRRTRQTTISKKPATVVLILRVNPVKAIVEVTTPNWFEDKDKGWVSYPLAEQLLLSEKWEFNSDFEETAPETEEKQPSDEIKQEQRQIDKFISDCLRDCLNTSIESEKHPHVLFMAEAQNARKLVTWLKNPDVPAVKNLPGQLRQQLTKSEKERLSIVRLREFKSSNEVPVTIVKDSPGSKTSGVFKWNDICDDSQQNIYLSIRKLLNTEQKPLKIGQSRLDDGKKPAASPKPLEIVVVYKSAIEQDTLANFVHNLRDRYPYFSDFTTLPFPFPLAIKMREYAIGIKDIVESEQLEIEE